MKKCFSGNSGDNILQMLLFTLLLFVFLSIFKNRKTENNNLPLNESCTMYKVYPRFDDYTKPPASSYKDPINIRWLPCPDRPDNDVIGPTCDFKRTTSI